MSGQFTHLDSEGRAKMVNIGEKPVQKRKAIAVGKLFCQASTIEAIKQKTVKKGDALVVAQVAGIQAAKKTAELIPLCHNIGLEDVEINFQLNEESIDIFCSASASAKTGVEMEALTGVAVAALTLYDMCKAIDKTMSIGEIRLIEKIKK